MGRARITVFSKDELEQIHETSLKILEEVGIKVYSEEVREILAKNGATVEREIVKLPNSLVEESIEKAPKEVTLAARNPEHDLELPSEDTPFKATTGTPNKIRDMETGKERTSTSKDLENFVTIADYLDQADYIWPPVEPTDKPAAVQRIYGLAISFKNTEKHLMGGTLNKEQAKWQILIASEIVGGKEKLEERPIFSTDSCPSSPLVFEKGITEGMIELGKVGVPFVSFSMALSGTTAPATIPATLLVDNAENLAALTMLQCAAEGAPMIYCGESTPANMRTGNINYEAPEFPLITVGIVQMARFYGLPCYAPECGLSKAPKDFDDILKGAVKLAMLNMAGEDITCGLGALDNARSSAIDQMILDAEAMEHAKDYLREITVDEDSLAFDAIKEVGPGGSFLDLKHTLDHFRKEIALDANEPKILPSGKESVTRRAKQLAEEILETHKPEPLDEDVEEEIDNILEKANQEML